MKLKVDEVMSAVLTIDKGTLWSYNISNF